MAHRECALFTYKGAVMKENTRTLLPFFLDSSTALLRCLFRDVKLASLMLPAVVVAVVATAGCATDSGIMIRAGDAALNPRQPANVPSAVVWVEGSDWSPSIEVQRLDATLGSATLIEEERSASSLTLTMATDHGAGQEAFLAWQSNAALKGQFLEAGLLRVVPEGERVEINRAPPTRPGVDGPIVGVAQGGESDRHYAVASLPEYDRVLVAWTTHRDSYLSAALHWRLVGRNEGAPDLEAGSTRGPSSRIYDMVWRSGDYDQSGKIAWGGYCQSVDIASGSDHFLMVFVCEEAGDDVTGRVIASKLDIQGDRVWRFDKDPSEPTLDTMGDDPADARGIAQFLEVVVAGRPAGAWDPDQPSLTLSEEKLNAGWLYGQTAVAYDSNRDRYFVVYSRRDAENTRWEIVGRFVTPSGFVDRDYVRKVEPDPLAPPPSDPLGRDRGARSTELTIARGSGWSQHNPIMVAFAPDWDRFAVAYASGLSDDYTLKVVEVGSDGSIIEEAPSALEGALGFDTGVRTAENFLYEGVRVPMEGPFVYGDLKGEGSCFYLTWEEGPIPRGPQSEVRRNKWCEP